MPISMRITKDMAAADDRAGLNAAKPGRAAIPYAKPSAMYALRRQYKLSTAAAAALLGYQATWWNWREQGRMVMPPDLMAKAERLAAQQAPVLMAPGIRLTLVQRMERMETRLAAVDADRAALQQRVAMLEAQRSNHPLI